MANRWTSITVDCAEPERLARFWAELLQRPLSAEHSGSLAAITGDQRWRDLAVDQALGYVTLLQEPASGLFRHFYLDRTGQAYIPGWGRGQGWALLGLLSVLDRVGDHADHAGRAGPEGAVARLAAAMVRTQRADGHWDATVDDAGSGVETSTACFMAVGLARAAEVGLAGREAGDRAYRAAVASTGADGVLHGVSAAVWASTLPSHYAHVPRGFTVPWGQGPYVLMLAERVLGHRYLQGRSEVPA